jgi:hypothetical protein
MGESGNGGIGRGEWERRSGPSDAGLRGGVGFKARAALSFWLWARAVWSAMVMRRRHDNEDV